jgi:hypothetical protein
MATMTVECPFCHTSNDPAATAGYCEKCGRKLPQSAAYTTTKTGRRLRGDMTSDDSGAPPTRYPTSSALLTGTILCLVLGGVNVVVGPLLLRATGPSDFVLPKDFILYAMGFTVGVTGLLAAMTMLARSYAGPAAWVSLLAVIGSWAGVLAFYPAGWPLALVGLVLVGWLVWTIIISRTDHD